MAMVTGMDPDAGAAGPEQSPDPTTPAAAAIDADLLARLVAQAVETQDRPRRSGLLTALATTIVAGLIAVAAAGYATLRADITSLHAQYAGLRDEIVAVDARLRGEIRGVEARLGAELRDFRAEVNANLLDHTDRLARLETASQHHTDRLAHLETALQLSQPAR